MAIELVRMIWCDVCLEDSRKVPGTISLDLTLDGQALHVDGCIDHNPEEISLTTLRHVAVQVESAGAPRLHKRDGRRRRIGCPLCGHEVSPGSGIALHYKAKHPQSVVPADLSAGRGHR